MGSYEYYLAHHGIKGQKWGVRRYQNEDGTLTPEGRARYLESDTSNYRKYGIKDKEGYTLTDEAKKEFFSRSGKMTKEASEIMRTQSDSDLAKAIRDVELGTAYQKGWINSYNKAANAANAKLKEINKKWEGVDLDDPQNELKYMKEVAKSWMDSYGDILVKDYGEHPYTGREWVRAAVNYNQFDEYIEDLERKIKYPV